MQLIFYYNSAVFGMNVGGVPWTGQTDPTLKDGFRNVLFICAVVGVLLLLCFTFPAIYTRISAWRHRKSLRRSGSFDRKSISKRKFQGSRPQSNGYNRLWIDGTVHMMCMPVLTLLGLGLSFTFFSILDGKGYMIEFASSSSSSPKLCHNCVGDYWIQNKLHFFFRKLLFLCIDFGM